jgi:hypothetical protein
MSDAFALTLARENDWVLLTGDGPLRMLAGAQKVECHGGLWVFDGLETAALLEAKALHRSLSLIVDHERCRLPAKEMRNRLKRYEN